MRLVWLVLLALVGCRDGIGTYVQEPLLPNDSSVWRLTWAPGDQRYPSWSADGDSVYYSGASFEGVPAAPGGVYAVPARGGTARAVLAELQPLANGGPRRLAAPVVRPGLDAFAVVDLGRPVTPFPCADDALCRAPEPRLTSGVIRVRTPNASLEQDRLATLSFAGRAARTTPPSPGIYLDRVFPFQARFRTEGAIAMRPSWSPDGERLVFSDGLSLFVWNVGAGTPQPLPGTEDGVLPAWSPDGQRIAYARWLRVDSLLATCGCVTPPGLVSYERISYWVFMEVRLIAPDGTGAISLGPGDEPAWAPDGQSLFVRRDGRIVRVAVDGTVLGAVPGTEGGHDPAVSPDGRFLAFARDDEGYDIWVVSLES